MRLGKISEDWYVCERVCVSAFFYVTRVFACEHCLYVCVCVCLLVCVCMHAQEACMCVYYDSAHTHDQGHVLLHAQHHVMLVDHNTPTNLFVCWCVRAGALAFVRALMCRPRH